MVHLTAFADLQEPAERFQKIENIRDRHLAEDNPALRMEDVSVNIFHTSSSKFMDTIVGVTKSSPKPLTD